MKRNLLITLYCLFQMMSGVAAEQPNVLFIAVDDLNDVPTFMGRYPDAVTPNMDRLAQRGTWFSRAHAQYPICGPSRASVMTGTLATTHGYQGHPSDDAVQERAGEMDTKTLPELFKDNGYHVMAVGKLFHRHMPKKMAHESGGRGGWDSYPGGKRTYLGKGTLTDWGPWEGPEEEMSDPKAAVWAVERLKKQYDQPFLMMVGFIRPHVPWLVPQKWFDIYPDPEKLTLPPYKADDLDDVPELSRMLNIAAEMPRTEDLIDKDQWHDMVHAYLASCTFVDHYIGEVLKALEQGGHADNTIIVLWSDHGYHLGEKNTTQKHSLWERSSHVPLIFAGPGIKPQQVCGRTVSLIDILPTLAELCSLPAQAAWEGRSIVPLLEKPEREWNYPAITSWEGNNVAVQTERFRYIHYFDGTEELYDHRNDLNEWTNLAGNPEYTAIKAKLKAHLPTSYTERSRGKLQKKFKLQQTH